MSTRPEKPWIHDLRPAPTVKAAPLVYGGEAPLDDAAEHYHEASKLYPSFGARQTRGALLDARVDLRHSTGRAAKRYRAQRRVFLPPPRLPSLPLGEAIVARRTRRGFAPDPINLAALSALLHAGYGVTHQLDPAAPPGTPPLLRAVPSGGALYPLELFVFAYAVEGLEPGLYHFDPPGRRLDCLRSAPARVLRDEVAHAAVYPELATGGAILIAVGAMFWRTRVKYGLRGYRFALLEAGHVVQNVLLTATGAALEAVPLGGFFDRRMDELLDLDGVNESILYAAAVGHGEALA
jgi:SagB-type dehydrogenase family enzyme